MMYEAIKNFNTQFGYEPRVENAGNLKKGFSKFIIAGMGGSNLVADLLRIRDPYIDIIVHKNYGLPRISDEEMRNRLLIADSYSGNTEETIDFLSRAVSQKLAVAVIATGGQLIKIAKDRHLPYIQMPDTGIQPRSALGFNMKAVVKLVNPNLLEELTALEDLLKPDEIEESGKTLAKKILGFVPVIYSSAENIGIGYNWKIKLNETGKIPAFYNVFSELNHNEMTGFDVKEGNYELTKKFYFILIKDGADHPSVQKRMEILEKLYRDRGLSVETLVLRESPAFHKIFTSLILADWTAYYTADHYGLESEQVPMIEEFKKLII